MSDIIPVGAGTATLDIPNADVSDELVNAGVAFGDLISGVGGAVANTQRKLNDTAVATTTALAETSVDILAVQETVYDDDGNIDESVSHEQRLPLITFIDPVLYQWSQVRLQGSFVARELSAGSSSTTTTTTTSDGSSQGGLFVILGGGRTYSDYDRSTTDRTDNVTSDVSRGRIRMYSELTPRHDIGVPKPRQAVQGPRLAVSTGEIIDIPAAGTVPAQRTMQVTIEYFRRDSTPIAGKVISIETSGVPFEFVGGVDQTDADGKVAILLRRTFLDETADTSPVESIVSARIGIVSNDTTVVF
jgi:hypothetical protein